MLSKRQRQFAFEAKNLGWSVIVEPDNYNDKQDVSEVIAYRNDVRLFLTATRERNLHVRYKHTAEVMTPGYGRTSHPLWVLDKLIHL